MESKLKNFIGIDVSKKTLDFALIINKNKEEIVHFKINNTKSAINKALQKLRKNYSISVEDTLFCMEYTGIYNDLLCEILPSKDFKLCVEVPLNIKNSSGLQRGKNDKTDAKRIALYCYKNHEDLKLHRTDSLSIRQIKELLALRNRLKKNLNVLINPIRELKCSSKKTLGSSIEKSCLNSIRALQKDIKKVESEIEEIIKSDCELNRLKTLICSVPGIGKITAYTLICMTNMFTKFDTAKQLSCYAGVVPFEHTSGISVFGKNRVSSMANKNLKWLLQMGALSTITRENEFKYYYDRKVKEGKNKMAVLNAIRNKIILRVIAVVKRGEKYNQNFVYNAA